MVFLTALFVGVLSSHFLLDFISFFSFLYFVVRTYVLTMRERLSKVERNEIMKYLLFSHFS